MVQGVVVVVVVVMVVVNSAVVSRRCGETSKGMNMIGLVCHAASSKSGVWCVCVELYAS